MGILRVRARIRVLTVEMQYLLTTKLPAVILQGLQ